MTVSSAERVSLAEIRSWFNAAFDLLERGGEREFSLGCDGYWATYFSDSFGEEAIRKGPPEAVFGSLSEDIEEIQKELAASHTEDGANLWHLLHHLFAVVPLMASQTTAVVTLEDTAV